jgi:hypothetical protein
MSKTDLLKALKTKKLLFAPWAADEKDHYQNRDWLPVFKKIFGKVILFSPKNVYYKYGKDRMNASFLDAVRKEIPDYLLMTLSYDEFEIETLKAIRNICPKIKIINLFGDDDWRYDDFSRYYAPLFDCCLTYKKDNSGYKKDGIKNSFFIWGAGADYFKPLNLEKKYDVTFIGMPLADRYDYIKFLKDNGIKINLFGAGWEKYPEFKDIYGGFLKGEDFVKVINQTKINLNLAKTFFKKGEEGQLKGRLVEMPVCKSFVLTEYTDRNIGFFKKHREVNFKTKEELLEKVKYFLKNDKERESLIEEAYKEISKNSTWEDQFIGLFNLLEKNLPNQFKWDVDNKIVSIDKGDFRDINKLKDKIKLADYVYFEQEGSNNSPYKTYYQVYSLKKSDRDISCCDYYVSSSHLGDYLTFNSKKAFSDLPKEVFSKLLNLNQLMVKKDFFLRNINKFNSNLDFITDKNTVFVSIPLLRLKKSSEINYKYLDIAFRPTFRDKLYSFIYQRKIFCIFRFLAYSFNNFFIIRYLFNELFNKQTLLKLKDNI